MLPFSRLLIFVTMLWPYNLLRCCVALIMVSWSFLAAIVLDVMAVIQLLIPSLKTSLRFEKLYETSCLTGFLIIVPGLFTFMLFIFVFWISLL